MEERKKQVVYGLWAFSNTMMEVVANVAHSKCYRERERETERASHFAAFAVDSDPLLLLLLLLSSSLLLSLHLPSTLTNTYLFSPKYSSHHSTRPRRQDVFVLNTHILLLISTYFTNSTELVSHFYSRY